MKLAMGLRQNQKEIAQPLGFNGRQIRSTVVDFGRGPAIAVSEEPEKAGRKWRREDGNRLDHACSCRGCGG